MKITIKPLIGINDIELGMHRDEVRSKLSETPGTFKKTLWSTIDSDVFEVSGLALHYNDSLVLSEIDITPESNVILLDVETLTLDFKQILNLIKSNGYQIEKDGHGSHIINELGIVIGEEKGKIDGWCIYKGNYQELCELEILKATQYYTENPI